MSARVKTCPGDNPIRRASADFLLGVIGLLRGQALLLCLQFDLASRHVNFCAQAGGEAIRGLLVNRLRALHLHLGRIHARGFGQHLQVCRR